ncbi:sigma-70 family RNA polymerase sigma factor [Streptomyces sviceus]|uniref:sigma-70 family RNA polymerase sigma factor n=1 Tax=Streptomyces sviceus TaxID=285530 RepID=UPI003680B841
MTDRPARVPARTSPSATAETAVTAEYVRIYEQEQPRLVAYARSLTRNTWAAEDLVAEAHFRVWRRLSAGHEIDNVPAYLMTTVRHLASSVASATHETPRDPQVPEQASAGRAADGPAAAGPAADPAEQVCATDLLVRVLGELPERWVRALWLADAEGQSLETVGRQIGAKQGATAVLLHRAREGMRQAFLRSQTEAPDDPACEVHWVRMPAYVRGNATPRQSERLLAHVDACDGCRGRLAVLIRANDRLPALVGPALLVFVVGGGTGKFLASLTAGSAGAASVTGQGLLHTARAAGPRAKAALASGTAVAAAVAIVLTLGLNESPATVTSPGRGPVAQGPVAEDPVTQGPAAQDPSAGPSTGAVGETPGGAMRVGAKRARGGKAGAVVTGEVGDAGGGSAGSGGGGVTGDPGTPEVPGPGASPAEPSPGDEPPRPPVKPTPVPPKKQQPRPKPKPEPKPRKPKPGAPRDETPVPEPVTPTPTDPPPTDPPPADPPPVEETPDPPAYSEPPTAPESPQPPAPPAAPEPPATPAIPPTTGDHCGPAPGPEPDPAPVTSATGKGVDPGIGAVGVSPDGQASGAA